MGCVELGSLALLLFAAEAMAPGAFMLWLGFAAAVVFVGVLLVPGMPVLAQVAAFIVLSFVSIQVYRKLVPQERTAERPAAPEPARQQLVGHVAKLEQAIVNGRGRVQIADAFWVVEGPDLPAGTPVRVVAVDGMTLKVQEA